MNEWTKVLIGGEVVKDKKKEHLDSYLKPFKVYALQSSFPGLKISR